MIRYLLNSVLAVGLLIAMFAIFRNGETTAAPSLKTPAPPAVAEKAEPKPEKLAEAKTEKPAATTEEKAKQPAKKKDAIATLEIGAKAPGFSLLGIDGKQHKLADYADKDILAILFTCNHCPTAQAAEARIIQMVKDYADQSFQLVAISSNDPGALRLDELGYSVYGDSYEEMKAHAKENGFNFPYLYDGETQKVAKAYGAIATPHIFIFDKERKLRYQGRVDDSKYETGAKEFDARNAINALLAGQPVPVETTRAFGCSIKWASKESQVADFDEAWKKRPVTVEMIGPEGIAELVANKSDKLRMINLWATWCPPCVAEFPDLITLGRQFDKRGFEFISIGMDDPSMHEEVEKFLKEQHAAMGPKTTESVKAEGRTTNNYHCNTDDLDAVAEALDPEWKGGMPHTILIAPGGELVYRHDEPGTIDVKEMREVIVGYLGRFYTEE